MNCIATVSKKGGTFKKNSRPHIHAADKVATKKIVVSKEVSKIAFVKLL